MEDLKINTHNEFQQKQIEELFIELGVKHKLFQHNFNYIYFHHSGDNKIYGGWNKDDFYRSEFKEITIQELKDLVVLKRNCESDASYVNENTGEFYRIINGSWHVLNEKWEPSCRDESWIKVKTKPVQKEKTVKEYLEKQSDGSYRLYTAEPTSNYIGGWIEVPEGANVYARCNIFGDYKWLPKIIDGDWDVLWQREKGYENKITSVDFDGGIVKQGYNPKESIIDKLMVDVEKHSHYKKDVSHLKFIDPYRIAELYDLHSCADHIAKKALCAGSRGHKDLLRDIQDIIDTAERWKQMIEEDGNEI